MKQLRLLFPFLMLTLFNISGVANAAESEVNWNDWESYSDTRSGSSSTQRGFNKQLSNQLESHIAKLSRSLPEEQKLTMNFTNIRLAGNVDPVRGTDSVRKIQGNRYPAKLEFNYRLTDAAGGTVKEGNEILTSSAADVRTARSESFGIEKKMLTNWFNKTFK